MPIPTDTPAYRDLSDWVVLKILDAIKGGDIKPGERLVEHEVGTRFGVSRAPVRDAFHKLEKLEVVERARPRGVQVRSWTAEDAAEIYLIMDALILLSVQLAIPRLRSEDIAALDKIVAEARLAIETGGIDTARQIFLDLEFHSVVTRATGRRRLAELMDVLGLPITLYTQDSPSHLEPRMWLRIHAELLDCLRRRDVDGAVTSVLRNAHESEIIFLRGLEADGAWHDPLLANERGPGADPGPDPDPNRSADGDRRTVHATGKRRVAQHAPVAPKS